MKAYDAMVESVELYGAAADVGDLGLRPAERRKKVMIMYNPMLF